MPFENETRLAAILPFLPVFKYTDADHPHRPANVFLYPMEGGQVAFVEVLGTTWRLSENGGEIMVRQVRPNSAATGPYRTADELAIAIPTFWHNAPLNAPTIAQRIAQVISGEPIDYDERISNTDGRLMMLGLEV